MGYYNDAITMNNVKVGDGRGESPSPGDVGYFR